MKQGNAQKSIEKGKEYFSLGEKILKSLIENREEYQIKSYSTHCLLYEKMNFSRRFKQPINQIEFDNLSQQLNRILEKDPNDVMARHIQREFARFLKEKKARKLIKLNKLQDLDQFRYIFEDESSKLTELMEQELDIS